MSANFLHCNTHLTEQKTTKAISARIIAMLRDVLPYVIRESTHASARVLNKLHGARGVYEKYVQGHCRRNADEMWSFIQINFFAVGISYAGDTLLCAFPYL
jgi:hypothetical protein